MWSSVALAALCCVAVLFASKEQQGNAAPPDMENQGKAGKTKNKTRAKELWRSIKAGKGEQGQAKTSKDKAREKQGQMSFAVYNGRKGGARTSQDKLGQARTKQGKRVFGGL